MIDYNKKWIHYLTRPFTLLGASLWQRWYDSEKLREIVGVKLSTNCLFIEEHPGVMRRYAVDSEFIEFKNTIKKFIVNNQETCKSILEKGLEINKKIESLLREKVELSFEEAFEFFVEMQLYTTFFPYFIHDFLYDSKNKEIIELVEKLRAVSYYPLFFKNILLPSAMKKTGLGEEVNLMTVSEIMGGNVGVVVGRKKGLVAYQVFNEEETIEMIDNPMEIISKLEKVEITNEIQGSTAYPGKVRGRVRLVMTSDPNVPFEKGDILVSPSTHPDLVPLFHKAAAIVTDEGGLMSHAAIVSREMKIPCVICTGFATKTFKDGDLVEVDAEKGTIRKLYK